MKCCTRLNHFGIALLLFFLPLASAKSQIAQRTPNLPRSSGGILGLPSCPITTEQLNSTDVDAIPGNNTPDDLVRSILGAGVQISNVKFKGIAGSAGSFTGGQNVIGFDTGILLSSGNISNVLGPNRFHSVTGVNNLPGDDDLNGLIMTNGTFDATVLEFDFVPVDNVISFQYVFSSDEYNEFANSDFNDVFGFFLNGKNVALLPSTTTGNSVVSINNVNGGRPLGTNGKNPLYYRNNDNGALCTEMDGMTVVLSVIASVTPNVVNHIKLAVADTGDNLYDSAVFIKGGSFTSELTAVDPNPANGANVGYASLIDDGGQIIRPTDPAQAQRLGDAPAVVNGATADGVTTLLLRMQCDAPVTFSITCCADGSLRKLEEAESVQSGSVTVNPVRDSLGRNWAFAVYTSPNSVLGDNPSRTVAIQANAIVLAQPSTRNLLIFRAPVVLVHGIWSKSTEWSDFRLYLLEQGYLHGDVLAVEYGDQTTGDNAYAAGSFDPAASTPDDQVIVNRFITGTKQVLQNRRSRLIAATQVDVVGHSMGGLVARSRVAFQAEPYRQLYNLKKGDIHKLITVGTPHQGTALADWLVTHKCDLVKDQVAGLPPRLVCSDRTFDQALADRMMPIGKAIYGIQTSSAVLQRIGATDVPSHAIVGIAPDTSEPETFFDNALGHNCVDAANTSIDALLGGNGRHDAVLPTSSQQGNIGAGTAFSSFNDVVHAFGSPSETQAPLIHTEIVQLLRADTASGAFQPLPAFVPVGAPVQPSACPEAPAPQGIRSVNAITALSISPAPGTVVAPGETVLVQMVVTAGSPLESALFNVDGQLKTIQGPGPYEFSFTAPNKRAGRVDIIGGSFSAFVSTHVIIKPSAAPESILPALDTVVLGQMGESIPIKVTGKFTGLGDVDVSGGDAGTTYATLSGSSNVVFVSSDGVVKARGGGEDTIVISHGGKSAVVLVRVNSFNRPPSVTPIGNIIMRPGEVIDVPVAATDPDGNAVTLSRPVGPSFATFIDSGNGNGVVHLAPSNADAGSHAVTVFATDNGTPSLGAGQSFTVTIDRPNQPPVCVAQLKPQKCGITFPFGSDLFAISPESDYTCLTLDGSGSSDPESDPLTINWAIDGTNLLSGAVVTNCMALGCHTITMVASDGLSQCHEFLDLCVITPSEAVEQCILVVDQTPLDRRNKRPLIVSLKAAKAAFEVDGLKRGAQMLSVFQSKVRAQVASAHPAEAALFTQSAQNILDALECATKTPRRP